MGVFRQRKIKFFLVSLVIALVLFSLVGCMGDKKTKSGIPSKDKIAGETTRSGVTEPRAPMHLASEPQLKVYIKETGQVKTMPLETYLEGVVAGEMKSDWPREALAAQAILARTFTMEILARKKGLFKGGADISTDITEAQAYNAQAVNSNVRDAVKATKGEVALYRGRYIHAWYYSAAGGITATAKEGLAYAGPEPGYIKVVKTPEENRVLKPEKRDWTYSFTPQQVADAAQQISGKNIGTLQQVAVVRRGPSGRADLISVKGSKGNATVKGAELRIRLGSEKMRSLLLTQLSFTGGQVVMKGRGFGHGVGMSQYGAYALAQQGKKHTFILNHYFKNLTIRKLYS